MNASPSERGERFSVPCPPLFDLGTLVATPGALDACSVERRTECLMLHGLGDFGVVDADDRKANFHAMFAGGRILSAYAIDPDKPCAGFGDNCLWIITEADRSATTFLLPSEY